MLGKAQDPTLSFFNLNIYQLLYSYSKKRPFVEITVFEHTSGLNRVTSYIVYTKVFDCPIMVVIKRCHSHVA